MTVEHALTAEGLEQSSLPVAAIPSQTVLPGLTYPYVWRRYQAMIVDTLFVLAVVLVAPLLLQDLPAARIALFLAVMVYEPVLTAFACTVGHRVVGIRVRRADDPSRRLSLPAAYLRWSVKWLLGIISLFSMRARNRNRALHDLAAGSVMINVRGAAV
jgi:hypothetical protein